MFYNCLFACLQRAALVAMVGAIVVEGYLDVGLAEVASVRQLELHVADVQASVYPHLLVVGLDGGGCWVTLR